MSSVEAWTRVTQIQQLALKAQASTAAPSSTAAPPATFQQQLSKAAATGAGTSSKAGPSGPAYIEKLIASSAAKYGMDPNLIRAVIRAESDFNPKAGSAAGAQGLMQLMPDTARSLGCTNPMDAAQNIDAGTKYLKQQLTSFGGVKLALAAYNAGPGAVSKYHGVPPYAETQAYVNKIMSEIS